jgi:hypothetical protein
MGWVAALLAVPVALALLSSSGLGTVTSVVLYSAALCSWAVHNDLASNGDAGDYPRSAPAHRDQVFVYVGGLIVSIPLAAVSVLASLVFALGLVLVVIAAVGWLIWRVARGSTPTQIERGANSHFNANGTAKVSYSSETDAIAAAAKYTQDRGEAMNAYRCGEGCRGWHIGHANK